ncbi:nuclear receptor-interacting protein 2 [Rhinophrynus dorsalis]
MSCPRPTGGLARDPRLGDPPRKEQDLRGSAILHQQRRLKQATQFVHKDSADLLPLDQLRRLGTSKDLQPYSVIQKRLMEGSPVKESSGLAQPSVLCDTDPAQHCNKGVHPAHLSDEGAHSAHLCGLSIHLDHLGKEGEHAAHLCDKSALTAHLCDTRKHTGQLCEKEAHAEHLCDKEAHAEHLCDKKAHATHLYHKEAHAEHLCDKEAHAEHLCDKKAHAAHLYHKEAHAEHLCDKEVHAEHLCDKKAHAAHLYDKEARAEHLHDKEAHAAHLCDKEAHAAHLSDQEAHATHLCEKEAHLYDVETNPAHMCDKGTNPQYLCDAETQTPRLSDENPGGWKGQTLLISCKVCNHDIRARLCTERQQDHISRSCAERLGMGVLDHKGPSEEPKELTVDIELGDESLKSKAVIVDDEITELSLGLQTLVSLKSCIDLEHGALKTPLQEIPLLKE